jgi:dTDP-4-dehydrorhamnose reductase
MNYLIFGGRGLVGKKFKEILSASIGNNVYTTSRHRTDEDKNIDVDIFEESQIENAFAISRPDVVINATNLAGGVDFCENNSDKAHQFHFIANKNIGENCLKYNAQMVMISTDYVFDGNNPPYKETDQTNPLNVYGKEKLAAEIWIQKHLNNYIIARTTNVYGWDPETSTLNYLMALYFKLSIGERANAPSFLWGNPTHVSQLCNVILELSQKKIARTLSRGRQLIVLIDGTGQNIFCEQLHLDTALLDRLDAPPIRYST